MVNEQLEFSVGEGEQPATVQVPMEEETPTLPQISNETAAAEKNERELDDYSDKVKKRIDKLTARLRETQRREQAALDYAKQVQVRAQELEQRYVKTDGERLVEAIEKRARTSRLRQLFVLTTRTEHWFVERGFVETGVAALPQRKKELYNYQRRSVVLTKRL